MTVISNTIASAASSLLTHHGRGHKKGLQADALTANTSSSSSPGSASTPTSTQGLFSNLLQSLEQEIGIPAITSTSPTSSAAATAATSAAAATDNAAAGTATSAAAAQPQQVQSFLHSLFAALKADGLGAGSGGTVPAGTATGTQAATTSAGGTAANGAGYGSLTASLQKLIQQLGAGGTSSAATANLSASFSSLVNGTSGAAGTSSSPPSTASLQSFLNNLLQKVQSSGAGTLPTVGTHVNANV